MAKFRCEMCGREFDKEWTDEEAEKEFEKNFGHLPEELKVDRAVVCDDCYKAIKGEG